MTEWDALTHLSIRAELFDAVQYYGGIDPHLGNDFNFAFITALESIPHFPLSRREYMRGWRRTFTSTFPYMIIYAVRGKKIYIATLQHTHRNPATIKQTIRKRPISSPDYQPFTAP